MAARIPRRLTLVSKFYPDANLFEPPPPYSGKGRPRVKGKELPSPAEVVRDTATRQPHWTSPGTAGADVASRWSPAAGYWYHRAARPLVPVRWVFVHDLTGTHRDEYFFTTDVAMSARGGDRDLHRSLEHRDHLRGSSVPTSAWRRRGAGAGTRCCGPSPCLFGLYTVVVLAVRGVAGAVAAGAGGGLAGQARRDLLGRDHGGAALAVAGMGFRDPRSSRGLSETRGPDCGRSCSMAWPRRRETARRPLPGPENGMIMAFGASARSGCARGIDAIKSARVNGWLSLFAGGEFESVPGSLRAPGRGRTHVAGGVSRRTDHHEDPERSPRRRDPGRPGSRRRAGGRAG